MLADLFFIIFILLIVVSFIYTPLFLLIGKYALNLKKQEISYLSSNFWIILSELVFILIFYLLNAGVFNVGVLGTEIFQTETTKVSTIYQTILIIALETAINTVVAYIINQKLIKPLHKYTKKTSLINFIIILLLLTLIKVIIPIIIFIL